MIASNLRSFQFRSTSTMMLRKHGNITKYNAIQTLGFFCTKYVLGSISVSLMLNVYNDLITTQLVKLIVPIGKFIVVNIKLRVIISFTITLF